MQQIVGGGAAVVGNPQGGAVFEYKLPRADTSACKPRNEAITRRRVFRCCDLNCREATADCKDGLPRVVYTVRSIELPIEDAERASPKATRIDDPVRQDDIGVRTDSWRNRAGLHGV